VEHLWCSGDGAPNLSPTSTSASVYNSTTQINVEKAYNLDLGVFVVIRERVSYGVEKAMTKGHAVSMRSSARCTWAAWCGKGIGGGEVQHNKSGGGGARLSRCWRNEAHT
jgi:hypothetical protein